jgi:hypothetical protein
MTLPLHRVAAKCRPQGRQHFFSSLYAGDHVQAHLSETNDPMSIEAPAAERPFQHQLIDASRVWYVLKQQIGHVPAAIEAFRQCGRHEKLRGKFSKHGVA